MNFSSEAIRAGRINQAQSVETPESFATIDGAAIPRKVQSCLKAIAVWQQDGARALELMNNPEEQQRVKGWMNMFGLTNQGMVESN